MKRAAAPARLRRAKTGGVTRGKFYLTYPKKLVKEPLIYQMARKFDLVFNVRSASVSEEIGIIALELDGNADEIANAVAWFREQGVTVEPIEKNVIE
jgi:L-aspartate semialdehyde sulfurtransferase ferredoxin